MDEVKVFFDKEGNTLTVWFRDPAEEFVCEETGDEVILMKDKAGHVGGFEKLNFTPSAPEKVHVAFQTLPS